MTKTEMLTVLTALRESRRTTSNIDTLNDMEQAIAIMQAELDAPEAEPVAKRNAAVVAMYDRPAPQEPATNKAVDDALSNLLFWVDRAVAKGNANPDIEEAIEQYNAALAAAPAGATE